MRMRQTLTALLVAENFTLPDAKARLPGEKPAYVTRLVHQLTREGRLRENAGIYSWVCETGAFPAQSWIDAQVHGTQLPQTPCADRPRERLLAHGAAALRTAELLAILIRMGRPGESALEAGEKLSARFKDVLHRLADAGRGELHEIAAAVGETAYCQIMAGIELGRRVAHRLAGADDAPTRITCSEDALAYCRRQFLRLATDGSREEFHIVTLNTRYHVIGTHRVTVGILDRSLTHAREVFRPAIKDAAKAILLVHNHPSGDPTPSVDDLLVTQELEKAGQTLGIQVLDHVIVARGGIASVAEQRRSNGEP